MLYEIGKHIPKPVAELGASVYVKGQRLRGRNHFKFDYNGYRFVYGYHDIATFTDLHGCIEGDHTALEQIPLDYFDLHNHDAAFDVGAHFGIYTVILGVMNHDIPIFAYEPNEYNRLVLEYNCAINDFQSNRVQVSDTVIASESGTVTFHIDASTDGSPRDTLVPGQDASRFTETVARDAVSLSSIFDEEGISKPFIKLDIEGAEDGVIADILDAELDHLAGIVEIHADRLDGGEAGVLNQFDNNGIHYECVKDRFENRDAFYFELN